VNASANASKSSTIVDSAGIALNGADLTVTDALAVEPVPPFVELTLPVVLFAVPGVLLVMLSTAVHVTPGLMVAPLKVIVDAPATGAKVALGQFVVALGGDATVMPAGSVSLKLMPLSGTEFAAGFPSVNVSVVVPPAFIDAAPNAFAIVGAPLTVNVAVA
jgi:hypothetical protein